MPRCLQVVLLLALLAWNAAPAAAIPPFARRYGFSCTTCHVGGPHKLSIFGEAFRDNGYRIPGESESFLRDPPIALGNQRRSEQPGAWRTSVWPGELPASIPLGVAGVLGVSDTLPNSESGNKPALSFSANALLLLGGSLGRHISVFGVFTGGTGGVALNQLFGIGRSLFERWLGEATLNVKVGRMNLDLFAVMPDLQRSALLPLPLSLSVGRDGFALGNPAEAFEFYGLLGGRLKWVLGAANGVKPLDDLSTRRDFLARLQLKLGGSRLDYKGAQAADTGLTFSLGAFTYIGASVTVPTLPELRFENDIYRLGMDARVRSGGFDILGQVVVGQDSNPDGLGTQVRHVVWSVGMDYPVFPWMQPLLRYEEAYFDDVLHPMRRRLLAGLQFFIRTNVRVRLEAAAGLVTTEAHVLLADLFMAL